MSTTEKIDQTLQQVFAETAKEFKENFGFSISEEEVARIFDAQLKGIKMGIEGSAPSIIIKSVGTMRIKNEYIRMNRLRTPSNSLV